MREIVNVALVAFLYLDAYVCDDVPYDVLNDVLLEHNLPHNMDLPNHRHRGSYYLYHYSYHFVLLNVPCTGYSYD
jgi:hypothetical protein